MFNLVKILKANPFTSLAPVVNWNGSVEGAANVASQDQHAQKSDDAAIDRAKYGYLLAGVASSIVSAIVSALVVSAYSTCY